MTKEFQLDQQPVLSRSTVDRDELIRNNPGQLAELWTKARLLLVDEHGRVNVLDSGALQYDVANEYAEAPTDTAVLLGIDQDGIAYWAVPADPQVVNAGWQDLRSCGALLSATDAGLMTTAVGLLAWHANAGFCARCGSPTTAMRAGWSRQCPACGHEEYPRTDPAVICLVHDGADHVVLARQPEWPAERFSILAGFVEAGESLEACVVREVAEEVGVQVRNVRYLASQPWPFPRSLMIGFAAVTDPGSELIPAQGEIEDARWVHRDTVRAALAAGGAIPGLILPGPASIALRMLASWAINRDERDVHFSS